MLEIHTRLPDRLVHRVDTLGHRLHRSRAELVRQALEFYLEELEAVRVALLPVVNAPVPKRRRR